MSAPETERRRRMVGRGALLALSLVVAACSDDTAEEVATSAVPTAPVATTTTTPATTSTTITPTSTATTSSTTTSTSTSTSVPLTTIAPTTVPLDPADIAQPAQPTAGPGGGDYPHGDFRVRSGGEGADAWFVFEPIDPQPTTAPLAIIMHGYFQFEGYDSMYELIRHTVLGGSIVIYPRWQTDVAVPCPGPYDIEPCISSAVAGIDDALTSLRPDSGNVQPELDRTSYFGFSFGGIITANLANRHVELGLPAPRVIFLDDPHDGGLNGFGEPALDDSMSGIPSDVLLQCHVGAEGVISEANKADSSCNALFPMLGHIPDANKDLVLTHPDPHGTPALSSRHGVCAGAAGTADAYDWNFCWKTWDALRGAADGGTDRAAGVGDTPAHRDNGLWSDRTPIIPLTIQDSAPIRP